MSFDNTARPAFEATAGIKVGVLSNVILATFFALLFVVAMYNTISMYEDVKNGNMSIHRFLFLLVRNVILIMTMIFFLHS